MALTKLNHSSMPTGSVLQVISTTKTDTQVISNQTFVDVLTATITPKSTNSKIFIECNMNICSADPANTASGQRYSAVKLYRDSTQIALGDAEGSRTRVWFSCNTTANSTNDGFRMAQSSGSFLDSPSTTSAITYRVKSANTASDVSTIVNRPAPNADATHSHRGASTVTLMEIAG